MESPDLKTKKRKRKHAKADNTSKVTKTFDVTAQDHTEAKSESKKRKRNAKEEPTNNNIEPTTASDDLEDAIPIADDYADVKNSDEDVEDVFEGIEDQDDADASDEDADGENVAISELPSAGTRLPQVDDYPKTFAELELSEKTMKAIEEMGFTNLTDIQQRAIRPGLAHADVLGAAKTGSGKTLAFLIPAIEMLNSLRFKPRNGTGVIIVSPTRELALQIFGVARS